MPEDPNSAVRSPDDLLRPGQVASLFGVSPKTVSRWGEAGVLPAVRTSGGHRRFRLGDVEVLLAAHGRVGAPPGATASVDA
jgi:excisionase family DNA binding protein